MTSGAVQGRLWGARARDWAQDQEQTALPLFAAVLDAAQVRRGRRLLDAGCGSGLAALLARLRGAEVVAVDASDGLLEIARECLPNAEVREADLEALPFADASFDATIAVNSLFYAADPEVATHEVARVTRPGGRVVATTWGSPDQCEYSAVMSALRPLMPPPPPGSGGPFAFSKSGALEGLLTRAGLRPLERGLVEVWFRYPDQSVSWRAQASSGVVQRAIEHSGEAAVREALALVDRDATAADGSVRYRNAFLWVAAERV